jgi:hypothetical protein
MPPLMKKRDYLRWIRQHGWNLVKAGADWKLVNEAGKVLVRNIIITHPGSEVPFICIKKTREALKLEGKES